MLQPTELFAADLPNKSSPLFVLEILPDSLPRDCSGQARSYRRSGCDRTATVPPGFSVRKLEPLPRHRDEQDGSEHTAKHPKMGFLSVSCIAVGSGTRGAGFANGGFKHGRLD